MAKTLDETAVEVAEAYLSAISTTNPPPAADIKADMLLQTRAVIEIENLALPKKQQWDMPKALYPVQIAMTINYLYDVRRIAMGGLEQDPEGDILAIYNRDGINEGIYTDDDEKLKSLIFELNKLALPKDISQVMMILRMQAERVERTKDENLVPLNNGIFDFDTKTLLPFSPDYVFTVKSHVDYNPAATNVTIHNSEDGTDWDVESWMKSLSDDPEIVETLWAVFAATLRCNHPWDRSVWLFSETGNNGKGTFCELLRALLGKGAYTSLALNDFSKDFMLEGLETVSAIITDENDVGVFIDKGANLKAIITGDVIKVNRKFKKAIALRYSGMVIQCVNEVPRLKDKSDSLYRRLLVIPMSKCFTGMERKYIKHDYVHRQEVLEYVAYKVLNMDLDKLPEPEASKRALGEYKVMNDPVRQFVDEVLPECQWDLLPYQFLYALYKEWFKETNPSGIVMGKNSFLHDLKVMLRSSEDWEIIDNTGTALPASTHMTAPEPLIARYGLKEWMNPLYTGHDVDKICLTAQNKSYRGLVRK